MLHAEINPKNKQKGTITKTNRKDFKMIKLIENYKLGNRIYTFGCESDGHNFTLRIELANKQEILEKEGRTATVRNLHTGEKREIKTYNGDNLE